MVTSILAFYLVYVAGISKAQLGQARTCTWRAHGVHMHMHMQCTCT